MVRKLFHWVVVACLKTAGIGKIRLGSSVMRCQTVTGGCNKISFDS